MVNNETFFNVFIKFFYSILILAITICLAFDCTGTVETASQNECKKVGCYSTKNIMPCANTITNLDQICSYYLAKNTQGILSMALLENATLIPEHAILTVVDFGIINTKVRIVRDGGDGVMNGCIVYVKTEHLTELCEYI